MFSERLSNDSWIMSYKRPGQASRVASRRRKIRSPAPVAKIREPLPEMERLGVLFSVLCSFAILTGPALSAPSASTTEISKVDAARRMDPLEAKNTRNDPDCPWLHVGHAGGEVQVERKLTGESTRSKEGSVQRARRSRRIGDPREDGVSRSGHREPAVDLVSHDTLSVSDQLSARTTRRTARSTRDYRNPASSSVSNTSGDGVDRRSIDSSPRSGSDLKDDIGTAEDRYPSPYPYWYQRQYADRRYWPNDRRGPYRNYSRYPVFPGR